MTQPAPNLKAVQTKNQQNLKALPDGGKIAFVFGAVGGPGGHLDYVLLIGSGHDAKLATRVQAGGPLHGTIDIGKGGMLGPGELTVTGVSGSTDKNTFKNIIAGFSKKKVTFR